MARRAMLALIGLAAAALLLGGCSRDVRVETGERIVCTYGEVTTDTIKTIEVPAAKAGDYKVVRQTVTCDRHKALEALYVQAQAAITAGNLTTARAKLAEIVKTEPQFRNAQQQIDAIDAGKTPLVDTSLPPASGSTTSTSTGGTQPSPGKEPIGPVATLASWVPEVLPGYTSDPIIADVFALTRQYVPSASVPTRALVIVVEQFKDAKSAQAAIKSALAPSYADSPSTFTVDGRSVYFGANNRGRAIVAWNESGILIVIEGAAKSGEPSALKSHLTSLVSAIAK